MARQATEILSLDAAKRQLRIDGNDTDTLLLEAIRAAVSDVSRRTGLPLLDVQRQFYEVPTRPDCPVQLPTRHVKSVDRIAYWTPAQKFREEPAGTIDVSTLGRICEHQGTTLVFPPDTDWPEREPGTPWQIVVTVGYEADPDAMASLVQATALLTRHYYEAPDMIESNFAVNSLLARWVQYPGLGTD